MIRVYYLPTSMVNGSITIAGTEIIHDALITCTEDPGISEVIMDTTSTEHNALVALAQSWREPAQLEIDLYNDQVEILPPDPDTIRAEELLASSPQVITQPEMWELLRIFGKRLGYRFD